MDLTVLDAGVVIAILDAADGHHLGATAAVAAELRSRNGNRLRLPDALVVATAIVLGAGRVVTTDGRWPDLPVRVDVVG